MYEIDFNEFVKNVVEKDIDVVYGSTFERVLSSRYNKALVRVFYPTFDEIVLTDKPLVGPRGLLTIFEKTLNEIMRCQERAEVRYFSNLS
jgi:nitrogenase molybdenum-iron protein alpha/beta subunit